MTRPDSPFRYFNSSTEVIRLAEWQSAADDRQRALKAKRKVGILMGIAPIFATK